MQKTTKTAFELDTNVCQIGKSRIEATRYGRAVYISHGRTTKIGDAAAEYLAAHPKLKEGFEAWLKWREDEIKRWKASNPHKPFYCDGGALRIEVDGVTVRIGCGSDGEHNCYITYRDPVRPEFERNGVSIDGPANVNVFDYDYGGEITDIITLEHGDSLWFWRGRDGDVALQIVNAKRMGAHE